MFIILLEDSVILNNMKFLLVIGLLLIGFAIYTFLTSNAVSITPANIPQVIQSLPTIPPTTPSSYVSSSSPSQREIIQHNEPSHYDSAELPERIAGEPDTMRHPERLFRPAPENNNTQIAVESGSASMITQMQQYRPEFIQNGAVLMSDVVPASSHDDSGFSDFN
jgi:hypothetical protein